MYDLPTSITIGGKQFNVTLKGDYRMILDCFNALNDEDLTEQEGVIAALTIFYEDVKDIEDLFEVFNTEELLAEAIQEMYLFMNMGQEQVGMQVEYELIDWEGDSQIIIAAVNNVAHKEVRAEPYIHWWTFMGYYISIGQSVLSTVVSIRNKIVKGKKLDKEEQEFKRENPQYFMWRRATKQKLEDDEYAKSIWNSGQ